MKAIKHIPFNANITGSFLVVDEHNILVKDGFASKESANEWIKYNTNIEWERGDLEENHDGYKHYSASGMSKDGKKWTGTWAEYGSEFEEILDIEAVL